MKKFIALICACLLLVGCGNNNSGEAQFDCTTLKVFNTGEYIDTYRISAFQKKYGVKVIYDLFASNEEMYTRLLSGDKYDVIVPSDYMVERMIQEDFVEEIDWSLLSNGDALMPAVKNREFDPEMKYSVPYFWGSVGIIYDKTEVDPADVEREGWNILQNTKYKGDIYLYDSERDMFMVALKALGYSMNTTNEAELQEAYNWLVKVMNTMDPIIVTDEVIDNVINGLKSIAVVYSGDATYMISENENLVYYEPQQGTNIWTDAMVIGKGTACPLLAHAWIDYMLEEETAFDNSIHVGYTSVVQSVYDEISADELVGYGGISSYTARQEYEKDEEFHYNEHQRKKIADLWTRVKAVQ
ncbi:MAG: ABC transporter substrate-binding protein [Erysipelotrichales bacterium]|nr:ABC transporter substrate-binding protein [Erysipelotrichales bacterium]